MSCGFLATSVRNVLGDGSGLGIRLRFVEEPDPRGTAGALKFAESMLDERFLMLNGDVLTDIDLTAQIAQHDATGAKATLALVPVADPSAYGLVHLNEDHSVRDFVEKPSPDAIDTNLISAGAYVLKREILELVPAERNVSIEREVWPLLVGDGLYGFPSESYWLDIGSPERYLQGTFDIIEGNVQTAVGERLGSDWLAIDDGAEVAGRVIPPAVLERGVRVAEGAQVGSLVVLGEDVSIGAGATVERSVILNGAQIGEDCGLRDCIVAAGCRIGARTTVTRRRGARRGRHDRGGQRDRPRGAYLPRCVVARRRDQVLTRPTTGEQQMSEGAASAAPTAEALSREAIARVDLSDQLGDVLALPEHLRDALWRVESAIMQDLDTSAGPRRRRHGRLGDRRRARARRARPTTPRGRSSSRAPTACRRGRRPTRWCCARATRATPRRRSPATSPPARSAPGARS